MVRIRWIKIREFERGLLFRNKEFRGVLRPGRHLFIDPLWRVRVDKVSVRQPWLEHPDLEVIVRSGALADEARVLDLAENQRALVWVNRRFEGIRGPGLHVLWTVFQDVETEIVDAREVRLSRPDLALILESPQAAQFLERVVVESGQVGLVFVNGELRETLSPGAFAFWRGVGRVRVQHVDLREQVLDVAGQDIMTSDKVTLRINALVTFRVVRSAPARHRGGGRRAGPVPSGPAGAPRGSGHPRPGRSARPTARRWRPSSQARSVSARRPFGLKVEKLGIRDIILPGEMKELLNRVTEARKAAEASLITRREETAAMRSQANTARIFESNPTLMRLRELEVLEKVAETSQLQVVLGESGLTDRVVKLLQPGGRPRPPALFLRQTRTASHPRPTPVTLLPLIATYAPDQHRRRLF